MSKVERMLKEGKAVFDEIQAPPDLENKLRIALKRSSAKRRGKRRLSIKVLVVCLVLFFVIGVNFETLAFYGKKLVGYDQVMNGTLQQLNELGKGQLIDKSYTFKNGVKVTLDGVMLDDTQLLAFLTVKDSRGKLEDVEWRLHGLQLKGFYKHYMAESGQGELNGEQKEVKWMYSFEPPHFYEKELRFQFNLEENGQWEEGEIVFNLDRSKALGQTLRIVLNEVFTSHGEQIKISHLLASPTQTIIKGSIQSPAALARDYLTGERIRPVNLEIKLIANGQEVASLGGGMSTDLHGITFYKSYDALSQDLNSLQLIIESFSADHDVNLRFPLTKDLIGESIHIQGQTITISKVEELAGHTHVTITTQEGIVLSKVKLFVDGKLISLDKTISDDYEKTSEGKVYHTRTLVFPTKGQDLALTIERMTYSEKVNHIIEVPIT